MDKVLLVEDDNNVREAVTDLLSAKGYSVVSASNGIEALTSLNTGMPDIIISDVMMSGMNGYEFFNTVRSNPAASSVPFLFLTARASSTDIRSGMNLGADDYITKPFRSADLLKAVELRLNKQKAAQQKIEGITSNISLYIPHELRTPLVSILGFSDLLMNRDFSFTKDEITDMASRINTAGKRLLKTTDKFITYIESDLMLQKKGSFIVNEKLYTDSSEKVIYSAVNLTGSDRLNDFIIDISDTRLKITEEHFDYIVSELIENALKFSPAGSPVRINSYKDKDTYVFQVTDYGRGMSEYEIAGIAPFFQHNRNLLQQDGNGLGLITIKKLLEFYGGSMDIRSEEKIYTTVTCRIPVLKQNTEMKIKKEVTHEMVQ